MTRRAWYERVNGAWPATVPSLAAGEAVRAAKRLYRFGRKRTWTGPVRVASGNRNTWIRGGELVVNPEQGWKELVHLLSHLCERSGHNSAHARMELRMVKEVLRRGWLDGRLKDHTRPVPVRDVRAERSARANAAVKRWETRIKRAQTMLRKARARVRYYERVSSRAAGRTPLVERTA